MRKSNYVLALLGAVMSLLTLNSCVDNDYDLNKDIDMTISIGGEEFAIPGGYTDKWTLKDVLDLDEDGLVQANEITGDYAIVKRGDPSDPTDVRINEVDIDAPIVNPILVDLDFGVVSSAPKQMLAAGDEIPAILEPDKYYETFVINKEDISSEIIDIDIVSFDSYMNIHFDVEGLENVASALHFKELFIDFPSYLLSDELVPVEGVNRYTIRDAVVGLSGLTRVIKIKGIDFNKVPAGEGFDYSKHLMYINGKVVVNGTVYLLKSELKPGVSGKVALDMVTSVKMGEMSVESMIGKVNPEINIGDQVIKLDDVPDFLQDKGVVLDVYNPVINVMVSNEAPVPVEVNAVLKAIRKDWSAPKEIPVPPFVIEPGTMDAQGNPVAVITNIQLSKLGGSGSHDIKVERINELIEEIPDEIQMVIRTEVEKYATVSYNIPVNKDYTVETGYDVDVPLAFGPNLKIVYNDTIDGWNSDIKDYEVREINLQATAYNAIPLNVLLTSDAIDVDGNILPGIKATVDNTIAAGSGDLADGTFQSAETAIVIRLVETVPGTIKKLDGITLKASATVENEDGKSTVGKNLNKNQYLQLRNIKLKVPGGIKIDLN